MILNKSVASQGRLVNFGRHFWKDERAWLLQGLASSWFGRGLTARGKIFVFGPGMLAES